MLRAWIGAVGCGDKDSATFVLDLVGVVDLVDLVDVVKVGVCEGLGDETYFDFGVDTGGGGEGGDGGGAGATAEDGGGAGVTSGAGSGTGHAEPGGTTALAVAECNRLSTLLK